MGRAKKASTARIVVFGESGVGKTCFTDMFLEGKTFIQYSAVLPDMRGRSLSISNEDWSLWFMDLSSTVLRDPDPTFRSHFFETTLARSDGVVLLYDITSKVSFEKLIDEAYFHMWTCRRTNNPYIEKDPTSKQRFGCILVGNKADIVRADPGKREVKREMAEQWAQSQGFSHIEVTSNERAEVEEAVEALIKSIKLAQRRDADEIEEHKRATKEGEEEMKGAGWQQHKGSIGDRLKLAFRTKKPAS
ncbi:Nn.00g040050.m01.CDS01 [Neocucurbitaria sp. VM-36]